jgi:anti-sigma B factor antagonist
MGSVQSPYEPFSLSVVPDRDEVAVVMTGELDVGSADVLDRKVRELEGSGFERIVIDLRGIEFMDSAGLRVLLSLRNDALRNHHRLTLVPGPPAVQRIFDLTATRGLFDWR